MMNTLFTGRQLIFREHVDSTNNYAATLMENSKMAEGAVVMAHEQSAGRGQRGTEWTAEKGKNLTVSIVYYPTFLNASDRFLLSQCVALALREVVEELAGRSVIKWPNDILCDEKKVAGILIETSFSGEKMQHAIIGIGLNVNQTGFPDGLNAASLVEFSGYELELKSVLALVCERLEKWYLRLRSGKKDEIRKEYLEHLFRFASESRFSTAQGAFNGIITGIASDGKLQVLESNGKLWEFDVKEVSLVI
ncbi:MAG TPA: biotin--[acetyl-CoA-carboxylase] ligase [Flavobacteriales bacterium]|nr:biotin--[acetyl-CoA-carboxylase] ligase [Flavobacteriales bacterium]HRE74529.1 biotin--[acetyl-CoA-carboxylase] ligase [Flavobacteriales bacterium]HRE98625.1 biotin--[acetyl-CoA-carboxylase] ligase [Flavobacteriales bacterium]